MKVSLLKSAFLLATMTLLGACQATITGMGTPSAVNGSNLADSGSSSDSKDSSEDHLTTRPIPGFAVLKIKGRTNPQVKITCESAEGDLIFAKSNNGGNFIVSLPTETFYTITFDTAPLVFAINTEGIKKTRILYAPATTAEVNIGTVNLTDIEAQPEINPLSQIDSDNDGISDLEDTKNNSDSNSHAGLFAETGVGSILPTEQDLQNRTKDGPAPMIFSTGSLEEDDPNLNNPENPETNSGDSVDDPTNNGGTDENNTNNQTETPEDENNNNDDPPVVVPPTDNTQDNTDNSTDETITDNGDDTAPGGRPHMPTPEEVAFEDDRNTILDAIDDLKILKDQIVEIKIDLSNDWDRLESFPERKLTDSQKTEKAQLKEEIKNLKAQLASFKKDFRTNYKNITNLIEDFNTKWDVEIAFGLDNDD